MKQAEMSNLSDSNNLEVEDKPTEESFVVMKEFVDALVLALCSYHSYSIVSIPIL
jgi:hypothetical protein